MHVHPARSTQSLLSFYLVHLRFIAVNMPRPTIDVFEEIRVYPTKVHATPTTAPLSIVDASVARFTPSGAIWYFDSLGNGRSWESGALRVSLEHTLSAYPQWAGQLRMTPYTLDLHQRKNIERYGRMEVRYGYDSDPGVAFSIARIGCDIGDALPGHALKVSTGVWACDGLIREDVLLPRTPLAGLGSSPSHMDPCVGVQITSFSCGGVSIAAQIAHPLADATALSRFMQDWSATHSALQSSTTIPHLSPVFEPWRLDQHAAGNMDDAVPDPKVLEKAHALPLHRYDWWSSSDGSGFGPNAHTIPEALRQEQGAKELAEMGTKMPWSSYNVRAPVSHTIIHYTSSQLDRIYAAAAGYSSSGDGKAKISRHDALVAHIWCLMNRARGPENGETSSPVYADVSFGLRTRLSPPLPSGFLGSPLQIAKVMLPWETASSSSMLPLVASTIKETLNEFTPEAIGTQIYAVAHELSPQRLWQAFLGRQHMLVTSWAHTGLYGCDFGAPHPARYIHPIMPLVDGCVQIIEGSPTQAPSENRKWYDDGVDVAIYLEKEATEKLIKDTQVRL